MSIVTINIGGTGGQGGKFTPLPKLGGHLYAGYMLGTAFHGDGAFEGSSVTDLSGNGRHATLTGVVANAKYMVAGFENFLTCPFSDQDIFGDDGMSIITVSSATPDAAIVEAGSLNPAIGAESRSVALVSIPTAPFAAFNFSGGPIISHTGGGARVDGVFEMHGMSVSAAGALLYRNKASFAGTPQTTVSGGGFVVSGTESPFLIGNNSGGSSGFNTHPIKITTVLVADKTLALPEFNSVYDELQALLALEQFGVAI